MTPADAIAEAIAAHPLDLVARVRFIFRQLDRAAEADRAAWAAAMVETRYGRTRMDTGSQPRVAGGAS